MVQESKHQNQTNQNRWNQSLRRNLHRRRHPWSNNFVQDRGTKTQTEILCTRQNMWERIFSVFGIPERIISDRDKDIQIRGMATIDEGNRNHIISTANHQQTDSQSERKIQEIQAYLRNYLDYDQIELLPITQYALNVPKVRQRRWRQILQFLEPRRQGWDEPTDQGLPLAEKMKTYHRGIAMDIEWNKIQQKK